MPTVSPATTSCSEAAAHAAATSGAIGRVAGEAFQPHQRLGELRLLLVGEDRAEREPDSRADRACPASTTASSISASGPDARISHC